MAFFTARYRTTELTEISVSLLPNSEVVQRMASMIFRVAQLVIRCRSLTLNRTCRAPRASSNSIAPI